MPPLSSWSFLWHCLDRAATDTWQFLRWDVRTVATTVILFALGIILYWKVKGLPEVKQEVSKSIILVVAPIIVFSAALFLFYFFRAPYLIYVAEFNKAQNEINDARTAQKLADFQNQTAEAKLKALQDSIGAGSGSVSHDSGLAPSRADVLIEATRKLPQGDHERLATAFFEFASVLDQANTLWGRANQEGGKIDGAKRNGSIVRDFGIYKDALREIEQATKDYAIAFRSVRDKWKYYPDQVNYIFGDNPENEGPNKLINALDAYHNYLDMWSTIQNKGDTPVLNLLEVQHNEYVESIKQFIFWKRDCEARLEQLKKSV